MGLVNELIVQLDGRVDYLIRQKTILRMCKQDIRHIDELLLSGRAFEGTRSPGGRTGTANPDLHRENDVSRKLANIPGIGAITASAMVASIGDAQFFKNGRQLAAWLGLVPRQHSSGGKPTLLGISKRGDPYLRTLLIQGARAVLRVAERKANYAGSWLANLLGRRNQNVAAVALANKNARIIWALLAHDRDYKSGLHVYRLGLSGHGFATQAAFCMA